ncbi:MAG TPA: hypothetical protein PLA54_01190 [Spirochaetota bacterium]|nr:hypothetical protein [Spirochaetota bacterium]HPW52011.1 hypothetical protein [Spirochaetota bacterium]HQE57785.1 hypothetical protein [Spirochaetota bacterium]
MKKKLSFIILQLLILIFATSCTAKWSGEVSFAVEGSISDVDIIYETRERDENLISVSLPWFSDTISAEADDETSNTCYIEVRNNTSDTSPITVKIYVDGELRSEETGSGAYCKVVTSYTIDEFE